MEPPIYNPPVPYSGHVVGGIRPGRMCRIQGKISANANGFVINMLCGPNSSHDDIGLHFNPRFHEQAVVRNAKNYSSWGAEERHGHFPFQPGQHFEIMILCEPHQYKVAVNGQHFTEFNHRVPVDRITCIGIEGDVTISLIQFEGTSTPSASYAPSAPMMGGAAAPPYPTGPQMGMAPAGNAPPYPPAPAYGFSSPPAAPGGYPQGAYPPQQPQAYPPQQPQAYPAHQPGYMPPGGGYPPPPQYGYPSSPSGHQKSGGLLDNAGKLLAGGLAGVGLASVANKIPGIGGHHGGHGGYPQSHGGGAAGLLGPAAALGVGGLVAGKAMKKGKKKNKLLSMGLPVAGVLGTGYVAHKGLKGMKKGFGHHGHSSSSSSSSSSEEE